MDLNKTTIAELWRQHKWAIILALLGLIFALFVISYGFFKALFIYICVALGIMVGVYLDRRVDVKTKVEDFFSNDK